MKGQSRMDNPQTRKTFGTKHRMKSQTNPKNQGRTQNDKWFVFLIRNTPH